MSEYNNGLFIKKNRIWFKVKYLHSPYLIAGCVFLLLRMGCSVLQTLVQLVLHPLSLI